MNRDNPGPAHDDADFLSLPRSSPPEGLDEPFDEALRLEEADMQHGSALSLADSVVPKPAEQAPPWPPSVPPGASDEWGAEAERFERATGALSSRPSWDVGHVDSDRFTFPPPVSQAPSVAPVAMGSGEVEESPGGAGVRWSTMLIGLAATLGTSALVFTLYGIATYGGGPAWGWNWKGGGQPAAAARAMDPSFGPPPEVVPVSRDEARRAAEAALDEVAERARRACGRPGLAPVAVRVAAKFEPGGQVRDAIIETSSGGHDRTARCVGELVREALIEPFEGADIDVSMSMTIR